MKYNFFAKTFKSETVHFDCKYMKFIYVNCGWRNEYVRDPRSY